MELENALKEIRKGDKRKFEQTVDLLISLKSMDMRRDSVNVVSTIPHVFSEKRVCGFLENKSDLVKTVTKAEFEKYKDKKALKLLIRDYDFFIASAKVMPAVATAFGKSLGPTGKMPTPQLGVLMQETPEAIKALLARISQSIKIKAKEPAIRIAIGKETMSDEHLAQNIRTAYNDIVNVLPAKKENIRKVMIKLTMGAPIKVESL